MYIAGGPGSGAGLTEGSLEASGHLLCSCEYIPRATFSCCKLAKHAVRAALLFATLAADSKSVINTAMTVRVTSNSSRVKPSLARLPILLLRTCFAI